jgi:hypothetical protein
MKVTAVIEVTTRAIMMTVSMQGVVVPVNRRGFNCNEK